MDDDRFDRLVQELVRGASRRRLLRRLGALPLAGGLAVIVADEKASEAKKRHHKKHKHKKKKRRNPCGACGAGCCAGGACQPGDSPDACGTGSATCSTCSGATPVCFAGACVCGDVCASGCQFTQVQDAIDTLPQGSTIIVCAGTFTEHIAIDHDVTLIGAGDGNNPANNTILDGENVGTVVTVSAGEVAFQNLRITRGNATFGGGIVNNGTLALTDCTVIGNVGDPTGGGGIVNNGQVSLDHCTVSGNTGFINGGGIFNSSGATSTCVDCDFSGNTPHDCVGGSCDGCGV